MFCVYDRVLSVYYLLILKIFRGSHTDYHSRGRDIENNGRGIDENNGRIGTTWRR
jgi:hypothetical protein